MIALLALQLLAQIFATAIVFLLDILPVKYAAIFVLAMVVALLIPVGLMFIHMKGKTVSVVRRIIACILSVIIIIGCLLIAKIAKDAYDAIGEVTGPTEVVESDNTLVYVRPDDPAANLLDAADYRFAAIQGYEEDRMEEAVKKLEEITGKPLQFTYYLSAKELADALFANQIDALIMFDTSISLLEEEAGYETFTERVRILYSMDIGEVVKNELPTEPVVPTEPAAPKPITERPFIMYISGSDTRNKKLRISRSDVNILVVVNPVSKQVLLVNTPRDYYIPNPVGNGALDKLTHCGLYGPSCSMQALGDLYGADVEYYAQINFTGFETLVDSVGGVHVNLSQSFTSLGGVRFEKGWSDLNGKQALELVRDRYHVSGGDNGRGKNQMKVVAALIEKLTSGKTVISNYSDILASLKGMFRTSISQEEISALVKMQLGDMAQWTINSFAVTGSGGSEKNYSSPGHKAYVMYPHKDVVAQASNLIQRVIAGEQLRTEDLKINR